MPRFYFNVHDGSDMPDEEGVELANVDAAKREAVKLSGALLRDNADKFWAGEDWYMDVTDDHGLTLFTLMFVATDAPSISRH